MQQLFTSLDGVFLKNTWLTIGSFDGVHIGHQQLICELNNKAHQEAEKSVVLTFHPHPSVILRGRTDAFYLTTTSEKANLLDEIGTDYVITHQFTSELSKITAREFVLYLLDHLGFRNLWVGHDFALGKDREGNVSFLTQLGRELNFQVHIIEPVKLDGRIISSSQIRKLLLDGAIEEANNMLGRHYSVEGMVVHGDGRGGRIGIPTANLETGIEKLIPGAGVYACTVRIMDKFLPAAVNIGTDLPLLVLIRYLMGMTYLDFSGDLYSHQLTIQFISGL
jgi:riboflavin kinase/FMN adenylyltransferase